MFCLFSGNTATRSFSRARAKLDDSGDYYCFAMVGFDESEQKTSAGIPIQVIKSKYLLVTKNKCIKGSTPYLDDETGIRRTFKRRPFVGN